VNDQLTALPGTDLGETGDERQKRVVGHREEHQLRTLDDVRHLEHGDAREEQLGTFTARRGHRGDPDDGVTGSAQRVAENRPDPAGTHDADPEPSGTSACAPVHVARAPHDERG
jgi:hypothetical protein